jgi:hypothetical protein
MRLNAMSGVFASVLVVGGAAVLAAPAQGTVQPGQTTQARVWVQNRGRGEAVPPKWEYRSVTLEVDANVAQALGAEGAVGWETTGIVLTSKDGNTFLLKRSR